MLLVQNIWTLLVIVNVLSLENDQIKYFYGYGSKLQDALLHSIVKHYYSYCECSIRVYNSAKHEFSPLMSLPA